MKTAKRCVRWMYLFPKIGEIIGGSQREESYDLLLQRIKELEISEETLWWYLKLVNMEPCLMQALA